MKKKISIVFSILFILTCGGLYMNHKIKENNEKQQEWLNKVVSEQEPYINKYLNYYYNGIESITLTESEQIPTGAVSIEGYVNNDKEKSFSIMLDNPKPGKNMGIIMSDSLYEMAKPESETPAKNMEEILKEERKKKRAEEKTSSTQNWFNI
ncbi:DUF1433 domain-containing protein [Carnobacterium maltaromaticum]|nr:DUF1433 domain-containing protein [Carnobacterium maltaromaticum]